MNEPEVRKPQDGEEKQRDPVARFWLSALRAALVVGLIAYILSHLTGGFSEPMKTSLAKAYTEELTLALDGTVVRDEVLLPATATGAVSYLYADGTRVRVGAKVASVYSGYADAKAVGELAEIDRLTDLLADAEVDGTSSVADGVKADAEIRASLLTLADKTRRGEYGGASRETETLLLAMLRRDAILTGEGGASALLSSLKVRRASVAASIAGSSTDVYTNTAGYFYSTADGYESGFDYSLVESLTPSGYRAVLNAGAQATDAVGKIVLRAGWYFVSAVKKEDALPLSVGSSYAVDFAASDERINMTLVAKNEENGEVLLVFRTQSMPENFDFSRTQRASVVYGSITGYRVPSSALRVVDGVVGVYVRSGSTILFRTADVLYESGAYAYVSTESAPVTFYADDEDGTNDMTCKGLTLYDEVIVSGAKDLFHDKHIN